MESLDLKEKPDQRVNLARQAPRAFSDLRGRRGSEGPEETRALLDLQDQWERGERLVTEVFPERTVCLDKREPREIGGSRVLLVLKGLWETRVGLESQDCQEPGV